MTQSDDRDEQEDDFLMTASGMTMGRLIEIQEADDRGEPLDLSAGERAKYEESQTEISRITGRLKVTLNETLEPINMKIKEVIRGASPAVRFPPEGVASAPLASKFAQPVSPAFLQEMADAVEARSNQADANARNLGTIAEALQDALEAMEGQEKVNTRRFRWTIAIAGLTFIAAAVAAGPPLIDWLLR